MSLNIYGDELIRFQKIKKRPKSRSYDADSMLEYTKEQVFGSGHLIEDKKVQFEPGKRDNFKDGLRPGIVVTPPSQDTNYETEWLPGTSRIENRDQKLTLFSEESDGKTKVTTAFLLQYRSYYKCFTLSARKFKLSADKIMELESKLADLGDLE